MPIMQLVLHEMVAETCIKENRRQKKKEEIGVSSEQETKVEVSSTQVFRV